MHDTAMSWLKIVYQRYQHFLIGPTLEVGSININGSARSVFGQYIPYTGVDIVHGPCVDVVVDIRDHEAATHAGIGIYPLIVSTEVLEHTPPAPLLDAMLNHAHPHGCLMVITCAGPTRQTHSADGAPTLKPGEYYANVHPSQLTDWLRTLPAKGWFVGWSDIRTSEGDGDTYAAWYIQMVPTIETGKKEIGS